MKIQRPLNKDQQDTGQTREMLTTLFDLARVRAVSKQEVQALKLLVVVLRHPASAQHGLFSRSTIRDNAEQLRGQLEAELPPADYAAAWERGRDLELEQVVADLLKEL